MESSSPKFHTLSLLQLIMGGLGLVFTALGVLLYFILGVGPNWMGIPSVGSTRFFSPAVIALAYSLILLPSIILPFYRLQNKPLPNLRLRRPFFAATGMLALWPLLVALGWFTSSRANLSWFSLPVLSVLTIAIPVWWFVEAGRRRLPGGTLQRPWGLLGYGVLPNVILILATEILVILLLAVLYGLYASTQPSLMQELTALAEQLRALSASDPERVIELLRGYLTRPGAIYAILAVGSVLMPLIEEMLKPLGMWALAGRIKTPAEGFTAGLVCGGAFAFVESLNLATSMAGDNWGAVIFARVGAGLLHVTTTGLVGWGLASAWTQGRYLRQALTFLGAVALHGLWNFFGLLMGYSTMIPGVDALAPGKGPRLVTLISPGALLVLAALMLFTLFRVNRTLRAQTPLEPPAPPESAPAAPVFAQSPDFLVQSDSAASPTPAPDEGKDQAE